MDRKINIEILLTSLISPLMTSSLNTIIIIIIIIIITIIIIIQIAPVMHMVEQHTNSPYSYKAFYIAIARSCYSTKLFKLKTRTLEIITAYMFTE